MKNSLKVLIAAFAIVALSAQVYAATEPAGTVVSGVTDYGQYKQSGGFNVSSIESGNITGADLDTNMSTYRWAGLTGSATGNIMLGDVTNTTMYTWTASGRVVYASNESSITWATLGNATNSTIVARAPFIAATDDDADRYNNTFAGSFELDSDIFSINASRCQTKSSGDVSNWYTYSLNATEGLVWAAEIVEDGTDYDGNVADYQMILPEDGTDGDETPDTYYLWLELQ